MRVNSCTINSVYYIWNQDQLPGCSLQVHEDRRGDVPPWHRGGITRYSLSQLGNRYWKINIEIKFHSFYSQAVVTVVYC